MIRLTRPVLLLLAAVLGATGPASAHVSEGGLIMLLPTAHYAAAGFSVVALTALATMALPQGRADWLFHTRTIRFVPPAPVNAGVNLAALATFLLLLVSGWAGTRDPLENPLSLMVWTFWWCVLLPVQSLLFDIWRWLNPFAGLARLLGLMRVRGLQLPALMRLGHWPGVIAWLGVVSFYLADIAPDYPPRLAAFASAYLLWTLTGMVLTSPGWWLAVTQVRARSR